jgi:putative ABC transport system substrate-binding protein
MKRRKFLTLVGAGLSWPLAVRAQPTRSTPLVGMLMAGAEDAPDNQKRIAAFRQGFAEQGWNNGDNVRIEIRWSAGKEALIRQYASELVALSPDVILANSTPVVMEFQRLAASIPIVFALAIDPVGLGQVKSLSHPGGNLPALPSSIRR